MATLIVTARGQITFRKDVLQHLGVRPGEQITLDKLPDGRITLQAAKTTGKVGRFAGLLGRKTKKVASLKELDEAATQGWIGKR
jgi:antitoxin PrlF